MVSLPYYSIPEPPKDCTASAMLIRVLDGLGFRYRWATEGLEDEEYNFRPSPDSMNQRELLEHIYRLVSFIEYTLGGEQPKPLEVDNPQEIRYATLMKILDARRKLEKMDSTRLYNCTFYIEYYDKTFPVWSMVNGPLCDALTHVGQIVSWRRLNGNPVLGANVFLGEPPK
jgi:hypothetical protein